MHTNQFKVFGALFFVGFAIIATAATRQSLSSSDSAFVHEAAVGQQFEVTLGKLATTNGASSFVKGFGQMMIKDHSAALKDLQALAKKKKMPSLSMEFNKEQKAIYAKLSKLHGAAFDSAYRSAILKDHKEDVEVFQKQVSHAKDADVKAFAKKCVPVVQKHLKAIQAGKMPPM